MAKTIEREVRLLTTATELRAESDFSLVGYAATFGVVSKPIDGQFREVIQRGAFTQCLQDTDPDSDDDIRCTVNHNDNATLGRMKNKTLTVSQDDRGLKFRCQLDRNQQSHCDTYAAVQRGDLSACSFAFGMLPEGQTWTDDYMDPETNSRCTLRTIISVASLMDVAVVNRPAYPSTEVNARSAMAQRAMRKTPYTQDEINAIREKLVAKIGSIIARAEKGQDVDAEVDEDDERSLARVLAGATYDENAERQARVAKVLDEFKQDVVVKWLRGETEIGSGK